MRVIFTGASSFTGFWFIKEMVNKGFTITATFQKPEKDYQGIRLERIKKIAPYCTTVFSCPFGSDSFLKLLEQQSPQWDIFCHHAAHVENYKSSSFDYLKALEKNTYNLPSSLKILQKKGCRLILLTGTIFEPKEGQCCFSPYGLSKGLTAEVFSYYSSSLQIPCAKFVIPNPFGPWEEPDRFTSYLMQCWINKKTPHIRSPLYVRDNIFASLLAKSYRQFILSNLSSFIPKYRPSWRPESQKEFVLRFAKEVKQRTGLPCNNNFDEQTHFAEPKILINKDPIPTTQFPEWNEKQAWDELIDFHLQNKACHKFTF